MAKRNWTVAVCYESYYQTARTNYLSLPSLNSDNCQQPLWDEIEGLYAQDIHSYSYTLFLTFIILYDIWHKLKTFHDPNNIVDNGLEW